MSRYVASDWHGQYDLAMQILNSLKEDDELYYLGDAIDRGAYGIDLMNILMRDKRVTYLKGNHEDMMAECIPYMIEGPGTEYKQWWLQQNGGKPTWNRIKGYADDSKMWYVHQINKMPERVDIVNNSGKTIILTHAGTDPWLSERELELLGRKAPYIWDRKHILSDPSEWQSEEWRDTYVIHGHTPAARVSFPEAKELKELSDIEALWYHGGHKLCLDLGSFVTAKAALFDLDTFEIKYFQERKVE